MENSNNTGQLIGVLLLGAAVGGALGILFAPDKGSETRRRITGKADDTAKMLREKFDSFLEEARREFDSTKEAVKEFAGNGKTK